MLDIWLMNIFFFASISHPLRRAASVSNRINKKHPRFCFPLLFFDERKLFSNNMNKSLKTNYYCCFFSFALIPHSIDSFWQFYRRNIHVVFVNVSRAGKKSLRKLLCEDNNVQQNDAFFVQIHSTFFGRTECENME